MVSRVLHENTKRKVSTGGGTHGWTGLYGSRDNKAGVDPVQTTTCKKRGTLHNVQKVLVIRGHNFDGRLQGYLPGRRR